MSATPDSNAPARLVVDKKDDNMATDKKDDDRRIPAIPPSDDKYYNDTTTKSLSSSYHTSKWLILRGMAAMYAVAFWGAHQQNLGLLGEHGLSPAGEYWRALQQRYPSPYQGFLAHPSLFWWIPLNDESLQAVYLAGTVASLAVAIGGVHSWLLQFALWLLYFSTVTAAEGSSFYQYGWESQILETGFLTIFLCSLPHWDQRQGRLNLCLVEHRGQQQHSRRGQYATAPSYIILWLFRWLLFRISLGAGLIKVRGDSCWTQKTCLHNHFETQPLPSPLSFVYHFLPNSVQSRMVDVDLWVQLYTSWFVLLPTWVPGGALAGQSCRAVVRLGGVIQAGFMVGILLSGNFSFLNHLTIIPAFACWDDACFPKWFVLPSFISCFLSWNNRNSNNSNSPQRPMSAARRTILSRSLLVDLPLLLYIGYLSSPVVSNLLQLDGTRQVMNTSFDPFRLVNTYGAFGSVGERRYEPIVQISDDGETWVELELPCKPGNVTRAPCFCAPYHYRLDWNIWFLGFKPHKYYLQRRESWLYHLLQKVLTPSVSNDKTTRPWLDLLDSSTSQMLQSQYYDGQRAPRYAKVDMHHYQMAAPLHRILYQRWFHGEAIWWKRQFEESLVPPVEVLNGKLTLARPPS